jgi:DNA mismatch repair protein MutL
VRDLFANVPARLKFLKTPATELKRCQDTLIRLALAQPGTAFRLSVSGAGKLQERILLEAGLSLSERLISIWPRQLVDSLRPFDAERSGMRVSGLVSPAQQAQARGDRILTYVNNRPVQNRLLLQALRQAFKGRLTSREYPQAVLFLDIDPQEVDVNVHPAKSEVRFRDERAVFGAVLHALEKALSGSAAVFFDPLGPAAGAGIPEQAELPPLYQGGETETVETGMLRKTSVGPARPVGFWGSMDTPRLVDRVEQKQEDPAEQRESPVFRASRPSALREKESGYAFDPEPPRARGGDNAAFAKDAACPELPQAQGGYPVSVGGFICLGQVAGSYLILVRDASLFLVDQHAAHERVLLHAIKKQTMNAQSQLLALPAELSLHVSEKARLEQLFGQLTNLGYSLSATRTGVSVSGVPPLLGRAGGIELLRDILSERVDGPEEVLHRMACRAAIKAGQALTADEAAGLLGQWLDTPERVFCPHGRPTVLRFDPADLEKMFKR